MPESGLSSKRAVDSPDPKGRGVRIILVVTHACSVKNHRLENTTNEVLTLPMRGSNRIDSCRLEHDSRHLSLVAFPGGRISPGLWNSPISVEPVEKSGSHPPKGRKRVLRRQQDGILSSIPSQNSQGKLRAPEPGCRASLSYSRLAKGG